MTKNQFGVFEIVLPNDKKTGKPVIPHNTIVKVKNYKNFISPIPQIMTIDFNGYTKRRKN